MRRYMTKQRSYHPVKLVILGQWYQTVILMINEWSHILFIFPNQIQLRKSYGRSKSNQFFITNSCLNEWNAEFNNNPLTNEPLTYLHECRNALATFQTLHCMDSKVFFPCYFAHPFILQSHFTFVADYDTNNTPFYFKKMQCICCVPLHRIRPSFDLQPETQLLQPIRDKVIPTVILYFAPQHHRILLSKIRYFGPNDICTRSLKFKRHSNYENNIFQV